MNGPLGGGFAHGGGTHRSLHMGAPGRPAEQRLVQQMHKHQQWLAAGCAWMRQREAERQGRATRARTHELGESLLKQVLERRLRIESYERDFGRRAAAKPSPVRSFRMLPAYSAVQPLPWWERLIDWF